MDKDSAIVFATLVAPLVAVQVSLWVERYRQRRQERLAIFKTLMATRATVFDPRHVEALNQIDVVFNRKGAADRAIRDAWKAYLDHLNDRNYPPANWGTRRIELLVDLLHRMAQALKYDFDKTHIKTQVYYPVGYGDLEADQLAIRKGAVEIMAGRRPIMVAPFQPPAPAPAAPPVAPVPPAGPTAPAP